MGFFIDIRGMLKAEYEGRYLEILIKTAAKYDPQILTPLIRKKSIKLTLDCDIEYEYTKGRRSDLVIHGDDFTALIEIKAEDGKNKNNPDQIKAYLTWLHEGVGSAHERKLILLNKYPTTKEVNTVLRKAPKELKKNIVNLTFSQYADQLNKIPNSNLKTLLIEYFSDEGLVMFEFKEKEDKDAFKSFMVLNFLPHKAGHGRQAVHKKIARGPEIFTQLVQNWQLTSEQFADYISLSRIPTVRYWSYQGCKNFIQADDLVLSRRKIRENKTSGAWVIYSDAVISNSLRLEFGIEYHIETRKKEIEEDEISEIPVNVNIYSAIRQGRNYLHVEKKALTKGIDSDCLKSSFDLVSELKKLTIKTINCVCKNIDDKEIILILNIFNEKL